MTAPTLDVRGFSHVCIHVSNIERSLAFYRDVLGLRVIFDVELAGEGMEAATGESGARGRMVGCLVPGSRVRSSYSASRTGRTPRPRAPRSGSATRTSP